jgi:hypothetical protein
MSTFYRSDVDSLLQAGAKTGELILSEQGAFNYMCAHLYVPGTETDLLTPMRHTRLVAMNRGGMTLGRDASPRWSVRATNLKPPSLSGG